MALRSSRPLTRDRDLPEGHLPQTTCPIDGRDVRSVRRWGKWAFFDSVNCEPILKSDNPDYPPLETLRCELIGQVVGLVREHV